MQYGYCHAWVALGERCCTVISRVEPLKCIQVPNGHVQEDRGGGHHVSLSRGCHRTRNAVGTKTVQEGCPSEAGIQFQEGSMSPRFTTDASNVLRLPMGPRLHSNGDVARLRGRI